MLMAMDVEMPLLPCALAALLIGELEDDDQEEANEPNNDVQDFVIEGFDPYTYEPKVHSSPTRRTLTV